MKNIRNKRIPEFKLQSQSEVEQIVKKYGYKCKYISNNVVEIVSTLNEWICYIESDHISWRHKNKTFDMNHDHQQRTCYDMEFLLDSIRKHEEYEFSRTNRKVRYWQNLFDNIHNNPKAYYIPLT